MIESARADGLAANVPWFTAIDTMLSGVTDATTRGALASLPDAGNHIFAGPDIDLIDATQRYDGTHIGNDTCATYWCATLVAFSDGLLLDPMIFGSKVYKTGLSNEDIVARLIR